MVAPNEALRTILRIAGWSEGQVADVVFTGGSDPVLPTPFRVGAAGAATLAAGAAATDRGAPAAADHDAPAALLAAAAITAAAITAAAAAALHDDAAPR